MIIWLNCDDNEVTYNKKNYLLRAAERVGLEKVFRDIKDYHPDDIENFVLNIVPFTNFHRGSQWTGVWELDQVCNRKQAGLGWGDASTIFLTGLSIPPPLKGVDESKHRLLFQACDPILHQRIVKKELVDFVHCGNLGLEPYIERERLISLLKGKYSFWDFGKNYKPNDYVKNISKARVQFIRSGTSITGEGEIAQRFFECLAIGPVLTNWAEELNHVGLVEGEDYLVYKNDKELIKKMDLLLSDKKYADMVAKSGRNKALLYHSYENRLGAIINAVREDRV